MLDADITTCRERVLQLFATRLQGVQVAKDAKTRLQEFLQGRGKALPVYVLLGVEGEDHRQHFTVSCELSEFDVKLSGQGSSRRRAEQEAARLALARLEQHG